MIVAIVDYGSGNLRSAAKAFERAVREQHLDFAVRVTAAPDVVSRADHIVLPGVGAFADCRRGLLGLAGMVEALTEAVIHRGRPFLGICVGAQLMASRGLEHGCHRGLDWIAGDVVRIVPQDPALKVPHMGWNQLRLHQPHPVLQGIRENAHAYFVHSYRYALANRGNLYATADYAGEIAAVIGRDNLVGTQFHPEKSQVTGLTLIANFLNWRP